MAFAGQTKRDGRDRGVAGLWRGGSGAEHRRGHDPEDEGPEGLGLAGAGLFLAGLLTGLTLGAGAALLYAPQSGVETRREIRRTGRRVRARAEDAWVDLRDELQYAARRGKRRVDRAVRDGSWAAKDRVQR